MVGQLTKKRFTTNKKDCQVSFAKIKVDEVVAQALCYSCWVPHSCSFLHIAGISEQPDDKFYKDEGGKYACLTMVVGLEGGLAAPVDIPMKCTLLYEGGVCVEDSDQSILKPMCQPYNPFTIKQGYREAEVRFRLEKVSRRKDNRRFCVQVEPDPQRAQGAAQSARPAASDPVLVLSKRRTGERNVSRSRISGPSQAVMHVGGDAGGSAAALAALAAGQAGGGSGGTAVLAALQRIERNQHSNTQLLQRLLYRVQSLERSQSQQRMLGAGPGGGGFPMQGAALYHSHAQGGVGGQMHGQGMGMGMGTGIPTAFGWLDHGPQTRGQELYRVFSSEAPGTANATASATAGVPGRSGGLSVKASGHSEGFAPTVGEAGAATPGVVSAAPLPDSGSGAGRRPAPRAVSMGQGDGSTPAPGDGHGSDGSDEPSPSGGTPAPPSGAGDSSSASASSSSASSSAAATNTSSSSSAGGAAASGRVERVIGRRTSERILYNGQPAMRTTTDSFERPLDGHGPIRRITSTEVSFNMGVPSGVVEFGGRVGDEDEDDTDDVDDVAMATNPSGPEFMGSGGLSGIGGVPSAALRRGGSGYLEGMISYEQFPRGISTELMGTTGGSGVFNGGGLGAVGSGLGKKTGPGGPSGQAASGSGAGEAGGGTGGDTEAGPDRKRRRRSPSGKAAAQEAEEGAMLLTNLNGGGGNGTQLKRGGKKAGKR